MTLIGRPELVENRDPLPAYDADTLTDLEDLFGRAKLMEMLAGLGREIDTRLNPVSDDRQQLARDAHALISVSGALGFGPLSQACVALEGACLGTGDVSEAARAAVTAGQDARRAIESLTLAEGT